MKAHVLVVEDEQRLREMLAYTLEDDGYQVTQAPDGETAIALLTDPHPHHVPYAVVITDLVMGDVGGIEVMHVARHLPDAPEVILLTGHGSLESAIAAVDQKAFAYLLKPYPPNQLRERVAAALKHRTDILQQINSTSSPTQTAGRSDAKQSSSRTPETAVLPDTPAVSASQPHTLSSSASPTNERYLRVGQLCIDTYRYAVMFAGEQLDITPTEYKILLCLGTSPGRAIPFTEIVEHTHGRNITRDEAKDLLGWHIRNLRTKFDRRYLVNIRGVGYMLADPEETPDH